jgi:hypothetical protein
MRKILLGGSIIAIVGAALSGCYNDNSEDLYPKAPISTCDTANFTYSSKVQPIFNQSCALSNCHKTGSNTGGYILDTYEGASAVNSDRLLGAIKWLPGHSQMPKGGAKLSDCEILKIETWITKGKPNN